MLFCPALESLDQYSVVTTIGFNPMEYNVSEGAGSVEFSLRVLQGELGYIVDVLLFTSQGSAIGKCLELSQGCILML